MITGDTNKPPTATQETKEMTGTGRLPKWVEEKIHELIRRAETADRLTAELRTVIERAAKTGSPVCQEYLEARE